jgi:hypothetical protein
VRLPGEVDGARGLTLVEGRVARPEDTGRGVVFELGAERRLSVQIPGRALGDFRAAGMTPESLRGRLVRVRGRIGRGATIRADHPEQIELLREP